VKIGHADVDSREEKTVLIEEQALVASFATQKADTKKKIAEISNSTLYTVL
jgi:hypothetical protein